MSSFGDLNRVNTNIQSLNAQLSLNRINRDLGESQLRLSTGLRINRAEDDTAGFSMATKLRSRVTGLTEALGNAGDAKAMLDISESSFDAIFDNLLEMKALATRAGTDSMGDGERVIIGEQIAALGNVINDTAAQTIYQDKALLGGDPNNPNNPLRFNFLIGERGQDIVSVDLDRVDIDMLFEKSNALQSVGTTTVSDWDIENADDTATHIAIKVGSSVGSEKHIIKLTESMDEASDFASLTVAQAMVDDINNRGINHVTASLQVDEDGDYIRDVDGHYTLVLNNTSTETVTFSLLHASGSSATASYDQVGPTDLEVPAADDPNNRLDFENRGMGPGGAWTAADFRSFIADVDKAIESMMSRVNTIGIAQSSLTIREETLTQTITANRSAVSRIMDTDFAKEQSESVRLQILQQTATAALAQANMGPQAVLGFLG